MSRRWMGLAAAILLLATLAPAQGALAGNGKKAAAKAANVGLKHLGPDVKMPKLNVRAARRQVAAQLASGSRATQAQGVATVGETKIWPGFDFVTGELLFREFTLRGVGNNIEVWVLSGSDTVSSGLDFPAGDCRNGVRTQITDDQVNYLIDQFDNNIYPKESQAFSVGPARDGSNSFLAASMGFPPDYYSGAGDATAVLVDNVRDENFYDTNNVNTLSYVAGFYTSFFDDVLNRLTMTIDGFDWLHRTGATPPNEPTTDPCTSASARPFLYESVFAHEYQHLLENYEDPDETIWLNEGLSDWAQTLTGYVDTSIPITQTGFDSHVQCFLGYLGVQTPANPLPRGGGPENSLNLWGDQSDFESEILCDYGAAYTMMELLADRFGTDFLSALHRDDLNGFESLQGLLDAAGSGLTINELVDQWSAMVALDGVLDDGAKSKGAPKGDFRVSTLDASINWDTDQTYSSPGAPPNGSDFVRLRDGTGAYLSAAQLDSISFDGLNQLPSLPLEWTVDPNPPGQTGDPALFAGTGNNLDRSMVREVTVPAGSPTLTFDGNWSLEEGFDYGYVQVSTDGGTTYDSIPCSNQVAGGGPLGPAFNGESGGFLGVSCDLSPWQGQTVVLAFRMVTDSSVFFDGFWVDDVAIDGTVLSDGSTLTGWSSLTQFNPIEVEGYTVRLIAIDGTRMVIIRTLALDGSFDGSLSGGQLHKALRRKADLVAAIVTYHDSTETVQQYAPYTLTVNGVLQPGGGSAS